MYAIVKFKDFQALGKFETAIAQIDGLNLYSIGSLTRKEIFRLIKYFDVSKNLYEYFLALGAFEEVTLI